MDNNKIKKIITIGLFIALILGLVWFMVIYPLVDFSEKEKTVLDASKKYYEKNSNLLPDEGDMSTVSLRTLLSQKYISTMKSTYGRKYCNVDNSWVKVKRKNGDYNYYVYLECGNMKSTIDHEGPVIKLSGDKEIEIEKDSEFKDPGIDSVYDDTDGKMNIKDVKITGKVNTSKIGTYKIKYSAVDSFENTNTEERVVKVVQTLDKLVKKNTADDNLYKGIVINNYIEFSNMLFRIVGLNSDGSVKIVSDDVLGAVNYKDIDTWLNDYFYEHLTDQAKKYMVKEKFCSSKISSDKTKAVTKQCDSTSKNYVGLLSLNDYNNSKEQEFSYLYPESLSWTSDYVDDKNAWATRNDGISSGYHSLSNKYNFGVNPVVNLKKGIKLTDGDGTIYNPYKFASVKTAKAGDKINTRYSGEYVKYADRIYRIIEVDDDYTKVISMFTLGERVSTIKGNKITYNPTEKGNVGYYIENSVSKKVKTDIFVKRKINVSIYNSDATYSGKKTTKEYSVKLAAPSMYELYSGAMGSHNNGYWLRDSSNKEKFAYIVSPIDVIYYSIDVPLEADVRFTAYIGKNVTVLSGKGTQNDPYVLNK